MNRSLSRGPLDGPLLVLAALMLAPAAGARTPQSSPRLVVSTSSSLSGGAGVPTLDDADLAAVGDNASSDPYFTTGHWLAAAGFEPGDVDGFARRPGFPAGSAASMAFTFLSNEGPYLDGDVVTFAPGGDVMVLHSEASLLTALGVPEGNLDVDAITYDNEVRLYFSLQSDLDGTRLGTVLDGDVLRLEPDGTVTLIYTEDAVQTRFTQATGDTAAIGDVQGIEWFGGEIWVTTQGPSAYDGAVIRLAGTPTVVAEEADLALGGAEIDALAFMNPGDELPVFTLAPGSAAPGDVLSVSCRAEANGPVVVLMAGGTGFLPVGSVAGFGAWYLDPTDPWLLGGLATGLTVVTMDADGRRTVDWTVPTAPVGGTGFGGEAGWSFQVYDLARGILSAPFRVRSL